MTSEQPDKYAYCENENNQHIVFLPNSKCFWIKFDLRLTISFLASGKAKCKNQKFEKIGWKMKILYANLLFDCFNGPNVYRQLTGTTCRNKHCVRQTNWSRDVYCYVSRVDFWQCTTFFQNFQNWSVISVLTCIKRYLQTLFEFVSEKVGSLEKKVAIWLFSILQYAHLSDCFDVISVGTDLIFWI